MILMMYGGLFDLDSMIDELSLLDSRINSVDFWSSSDKNDVINRKSFLSNLINPIVECKNKINFNIELLSDEVDEEFAAKEGEGDLSLAYWQEVHRIFLGMDYEAINKPFDEKGICVLEEFKLIYKA